MCMALATVLYTTPPLGSSDGKVALQSQGMAWLEGRQTLLAGSWPSHGTCITHYWLGQATHSNLPMHPVAMSLP